MVSAAQLLKRMRQLDVPDALILATEKALTEHLPRCARPGCESPRRIGYGGLTKYCETHRSESGGEWIDCDPHGMLSSASKNFTSGSVALF